MLNKNHQAFMNLYLKEENISYNQYELLLYIYYDEGSIQRKIASDSGIDACGASILLKILEDKEINH
jgi:DNA-binding MarR family transcriptional regulator